MAVPAKKQGGTKQTETGKPLYAVGDYITRDDWIIQKIVAVIADDPKNPLYGIWNHKKNDILWETQHELNTQKLSKVTPQFDKWAKVRVGDMLHAGVHDESSYLAVLARVGDVVMVSETPIKGKTKRKVSEMAEKLEELTDGAVSRQEIEESAGVNRSSSDAYKTASNQWYTVEKLALMNWRLLAEE